MNQRVITLRRCVNFSKDWGYGKCVIINLFAYRTTKKQDKPIGYKNNHHIKMQSANAGIVVAAWGNHGSFLKRDEQES